MKYTEQQYEERIARLVAALEMARGRFADIADMMEAGESYTNWGFFRASAARCESALSTERAHRTAEQAGVTAPVRIRCEHIGGAIESCARGEYGGVLRTYLDMHGERECCKACMDAGFLTPTVPQ